VVWAKGTGYGHGQRSSSATWDAKASKAAQEAQDAELQECLSILACSLSWQLCDGGAASSAAPDAPSTSGRTGAAEAERHRIPMQQLLGIVRDSVLVPYLAMQLANASFSDMGSRVKYFGALLQVGGRAGGRAGGWLLLLLRQLRSLGRLLGGQGGGGLRFGSRKGFWGASLLLGLCAVIAPLPHPPGNCGTAPVLAQRRGAAAPNQAPDPAHPAAHHPQVLKHLTRREAREALTLPVRGRAALAASLFKLLPSARRYQSAMASISSAAADGSQPGGSSSRMPQATTAEEQALAEAHETLLLADMVVAMCSGMEGMGITAAMAAGPAAAAPSGRVTRSQQAAQQQQRPAQQSYIEALAGLKVGARLPLASHDGAAMPALLQLRLLSQSFHK
jgi:hypothetical protein